MPQTTSLQKAAAGLVATLAVCLVWYGASTHLERACVMQDTPYLPLCADISPTQSKEVQIQQLRNRLRNNPGEARTWVALANVETDAAQPVLLRALATLAPSNQNALSLRAKQALAQNDLPLATELLVKMTDHGIAGAAPPQILARILTSTEGPALLRPHLVAGSRWLPPVLESMAALKLPLEPGLPLLAEAGAKGIVTKDTVRSFVQSLKAAGKWGDAYGLWVAQQHQPVPILFNGSFDQRMEADGFGWEASPAPPSRAGARLAQRNVDRHGQVLEIEYTGKAIDLPIIRQYLFLPPGRYALQGQYMSSRLRMEQGLAWSVRCTDGAKAMAGRSDAMQDTAASWKTFRFEFNIPPDCGTMASLQLETYAPYEAAAGIRGKASFDDLVLTHLGAQAR